MNSHTSLAIFLALMIWNCNISESSAYRINSHQLLHNLRSTYDFRDIPMRESADAPPVAVTLDVNLIDIVQADKSTNQLDLVIWKMMSWKTNIMWPPEGEHSYNISQLRVRADRMWVPDIVVYGATAPTQDIYPVTDFFLQYNGEVWYVPSQRIRVMCDLADVDSEEGAECAIKFGSWSYSGHQIDLAMKEGSNGMTLNNYFTSSYEILNNTAQRNVHYYACCPEPYVDVTYNLRIRTRRSNEGYFSSWL